MGTLAPQVVGPTGTVITPVAAGGSGDIFPCGDRNHLEVTNASGSAITATVDSASVCNQGFDHDLAVSVAAGTTKRIGPLPAGRFQQSDGLGHVSYSSTTSVTVALVTA